MSYIGNNKIGKMYLGDTEIAKAYLGNTLVFSKGGVSTYNRLPEGFAELMYVSTDSQAWIDTGVSGALDLEINTRFSVGKYVQYGAVFGNYIDESHGTFRAILANTKTFYVGNGSSNSTVVGDYSYDSVMHLILKTNEAILNGVSTALSSGSLSVGTDNICLGNRSVSTTVDRDISLKVYSFSIKKNGSLVIDLVPCKRLSDDAIGFYDLVGETFIKSLTGTEFAAGPVPTKSFIRSYNGAYIDTGVTPDQNTKVILWARNFNPTTGFIFGSRVGTNNSAFALGSHTGAAINRFRFDFGTTINYADGDMSNMYGFHKYTLDGNKCYVDDVLVATSSETTVSNAYNLYIFGINTSGTLSKCNLPLDVCACKIYKNGVLVRDFIPVYSPSPGLLDSVSGNVYTNQGGGILSFGTFVKNAYYPLGYISANGNQHFDSGVFGTYNLPISCVFMPTDSVPKYHSLLGERVASPANSCDISLGNTTTDNAYVYWRFGENTTSSQAFSGSSTNKLTNSKIVVYKTGQTLSVYKNNAQVGTSSKTNVSTSFSTTYTMGVGDYKSGSSSYTSDKFVGRLYYVGFGAMKSFVPAKVGTEVGMYDTYSDVFVGSETSYPFLEPII